jgi:8-amino-7-oxononanoate synthase
MSSEVAIIGMACRFPDAPNPDVLWKNILERKASFTQLERQRWNHRRFLGASSRQTDRTCGETAALIDDVDLFAGAYFGIAPRRAEAMDPQHRIMLELVYQALQDAGIERPYWNRAKTATFIGASVTEYKELNLIHVRSKMLGGGEFGTLDDTGTPGDPGNAPLTRSLTNRSIPMRAYTLPGSLLNMNASVISQTYDLGGPAYTIDAACASSLTAVVRGVEYLRGLPEVDGPAPLALVGGVYLNFLPDNMVAFSRIGAIARRDCRPFDAGAEGYVVGEGAGLVILKRLDYAQRDKDRIYAVIRGVAANSDGRSTNLLAPQLAGQVALLQAGLEDAEMAPEQIQYVEAHGTATITTDEVELRSLTAVLGETGEKVHIGSIKGNIGHGMSAAGIGSFLRATLAIYHSTMPPQAGWERWHPNLIPYSDGFSIDTEPYPWDSPIRRALVKAFGLGGTNSVVVLESAPLVENLPVTQAPQLFCFSAPTPELLKIYHEQWMAAAAHQPLARLAYTQTLTRKVHRYGFVAVARSLEDLRVAPPAFALDKKEPLQLVGASQDDLAWLTERGVPVSEEGFVMRMDQLDNRLVALGTAWLLGHPVMLEDLFPTRQVADLPSVPLERQRYWAVQNYRPNHWMTTVFEQVSTVTACEIETLRPELHLRSDLNLTSAQQLELMRSLGLPESELWRSDSTLGQLGEALETAERPPTLPLDFKVGYDTHPFVSDYYPGGRTVLPLAFALDVLATGLAVRTPFALERVEVRRSLQVRDEADLRLAQEDEEMRLIEVKGSREVVAFSAMPGEVTAATLEVPSNGVATSTDRVPGLGLKDFYRDVAFHGPLMQGISEVYLPDANHIRGTARTSVPRQWIPDDTRDRWTIDPLLVDSAFQMLLYWSYNQHQKSSQPMEIARVVWLQHPQAGEVQVDWELHSSSDSEVDGTVTFRQHGQRLGWLEGVRARLQSLRPKSDDGHLVESLPGYVELQRRMRAADERGIAIPYFQSHDEVRGVFSQIEGRELINFSSYNYVGLSGHPRVNAASNAATERYGTSVSASRLVAGERPFHRDLEEGIANFLGTEDAVVMVSGYLTNVTVISHLLEAGDLILYDSFSHDSILKGVRASAATRQAFPHNDMDALEERLLRIGKSFRRVLVVVEGVYSMDGDYPDLTRLVELRDRFQFWLMIDEAHSLGCLGATGRGIGEHFGVARDKVDLWTGTLSKSLASCGGYVAGRRNLIEYIKFTTPGFVYSVGMPPSSAAAALAALEVLIEEPERVLDLQRNSEFFRDQVRKYGLNCGLNQATPVVPVITGDSAVAWELARLLALRGINCCPVVYPAVDEKSARLRYFITNLHTYEQLEYAAKTTAECLADVKVVAGAKI